MALIDDVKATLRISSSSFNTEITDLISACKSDLTLSGILTTDETDSLIKRAIITYVKAYFGYDNPDHERLKIAYEMLKNHLSLSGNYAFYTVTFTVQDSDTNAIREATVTFNGETKTTGEAGTAVFYVRPDNNYYYSVSAENYTADDDEDNLIDVVDENVSETVTLS